MARAQPVTNVKTSAGQTPANRNPTRTPRVAAVTAIATPESCKSLTRSPRSATTPAGIPTRRSGRLRRPSATPTINAESVSSRMYQPRTTCSPTMLSVWKKTPTLRQRKSRCAHRWSRGTELRRTPRILTYPPAVGQVGVTAEVARPRGTRALPQCGWTPSGHVSSENYLEGTSLVDPDRHPDLTHPRRVGCVDVRTSWLVGCATRRAT